MSIVKTQKLDSTCGALPLFTSILFVSHFCCFESKVSFDYVQTETREGGQGTCGDHSVGKVTGYRHGDFEVRRAHTVILQRKDL